MGFASKNNRWWNTFSFWSESYYSSCKRYHLTVICVERFYVNILPTCLPSSYQSSVSLSKIPRCVPVPNECCPRTPAADIINEVVEYFLWVFFFPVVCSPACKWTCLWVRTSESVMRSWYELAQRRGSRRRSAEVAAAGNADQNSTFGTKLYCEALYQLNRWMTMGFN